MAGRIQVLAVFGTRPEAIKMAPLIRALRERPDCFELRTCVTGQHRALLDPVLGFFGIQPDHDLDLMRPDQGLGDITEGVLAGLRPILGPRRPDWLLVQGDTTTAFAAALAAFYGKIRVGHVEAGLRTGDPASPWPEEINRRLITVMADLHFAPTPGARANLLREGVDPGRAPVTGNTVVDALELAMARIREDAALRLSLEGRFRFLDPKRRLILVTGHRRESFGGGLAGVCLALRRIVDENPGVELVFPVHLNPNVRRPVREILDQEIGDAAPKEGPAPGRAGRIHLIEPVDYPSFVYLMTRARLIITDSGGIQEEAPSLGTPVLVTRESTERPEGLRTGGVLLVGTRPEEIQAAARAILEEGSGGARPRRSENPYGDGKAAARIVERLEREMNSSCFGSPHLQPALHP